SEQRKSPPSYRQPLFRRSAPANRFVQPKTVTNVPGFQAGVGGGNCITDAGGVADISRWCKPPVTHTKFDEPRQGRRNGRRAISAAPAGARIQPSMRTRRGGLISNVPPGQLRSSNPRTP